MGFNVRGWARAHPLVETFLAIKGNARACVLTEPLWGIPHKMVMPFATLYMYSLGVGDAEIGLALSAGMLCQVFGALAGGLITDKLGRRLTTFALDFVAWTVPSFILAGAQNFWWFLIAAAINSTWRITNTSWSCLLVEDAPKTRLAQIYTLIYISGRLSVFFAPLAALLIQKFSLVPTLRGLYAASAVLMGLKSLLLFLFSRETQQGLVRKAETKGLPLWRMAAGYRAVFVRLVRDPRTARILLLAVLANIVQAVLDNFFSLFAAGNLGVLETSLAFFPILRAAIMLALFLMPARRRAGSLKKPMLAGLALYGASHLALLLAPPGRMGLILLHVAGEALAYALFMPRQDALMALYVNPQERARTMAVIGALIVAVSSPFGAVAGMLSQVDRRLPFLLNLALLALMGVLAAQLRETPEAERT